MTGFKVVIHRVYVQDYEVLRDDYPEEWSDEDIANWENTPGAHESALEAVEKFTSVTTEVTFK